MTRSTATNLILFFLLALACAGFVFFAKSDESLVRLYFFWKPGFLLLAKIACFALLLFVFARRLRPEFIGISWTKLFGALVFFPVLILPVFRCYFKVPYVFCRACYDKCPWGLLRTFLFSTFTLTNLSGRFWCVQACPFGSFQEGLASVSRKRVRVTRLLSVTAYIILFIVAWLYIMSLRASVRYFENGVYAWRAFAALCAAVLVSAAYFSPRFWCRAFCPVGTIAAACESARRGLKKIFRRFDT